MWRLALCGVWVQALSEQWEKYRPQNISEEERKKALSDMAKKVKGKVVELGTNHKTSRLIQAILKQGTTAEKDLIWKEVREKRRRQDRPIWKPALSCERLSALRGRSPSHETDKPPGTN